MNDIDIYKGGARRHPLAATSTRSFEIGPSQQREGRLPLSIHVAFRSRPYRVPRHHRKLLEKKYEVNYNPVHGHSLFHQSPRQPVEIRKELCGTELELVEHRCTLYSIT
jgi:hypothetical protein